MFQVALYCIIRNTRRKVDENGGSSMTETKPTGAPALDLRFLRSVFDELTGETQRSSTLLRPTSSDPPAQLVGTRPRDTE